MNKMTKHTKGNWNNLTISKKRSTIDDDNGNNIADVWSLGEITSEEMQANANLISAAPDLLESVKYLKTILKTLVLNTEGDGSQIGDVLLHASQAIKKATGSTI